MTTAYDAVTARIASPIVDIILVGDSVGNVCLGCAPCKGGAFQWVQAPPGNRSSRKQPEQLWR